VKNITTKSKYEDLYENAQKRFDRFLYWTDFGKGKQKVLDFGCGCGWLLNYLSQHFVNNQYFGIDTFKDDIKYANSKIKENNIIFLHYDSIDRLPFKDNFFDFIISNEVLEHVEDPEFYVSELSRVMKNNSYGFFSTPNNIFPFEFHYNLPLINLLPSSMFNRFEELYSYPYVKGLLKLKGIKIKENIINDRLRYFLPQKYIIQKRGG